MDSLFEKITEANEKNYGMEQVSIGYFRCLREYQ